MNPASLTRFSIATTSGTADAENPAGITTAGTDTKLTGLCGLLKHHTADQFVSVLRQHRAWQKQLGVSLTDQHAPEAQWTEGLGTWLLANREAAAFLALLEMLKSEPVEIADKTAAETLLEAVRSTTSINGVEVMLALSLEPQDQAEMIAPLAAAFRVNNGLANLRITFQMHHHGSLAPLLDALCTTEGLRLSVIGLAFDPGIMTMLVTLFAKNNAIESFELRQPLSLGTGSTPHYTAGLNALLLNILMQSRLQFLHLDGVPQASQATLALIIFNNRTITGLGLSLDGHDFTPLLGAALAGNTLIAKLDVRIPSIGDGMLPLIQLIADNACHLKDVTLGTGYGRMDDQDVRMIGDMLASNVTLACFKWDLTSWESFDLVMLGESLAKNATLERLVIHRHHIGDRNRMLGFQSNFDAWIPDFVSHLSKNRTLTDLEFFLDIDDFASKGLFDPAIDNIIKRNLSDRHYVCSDAFINGAACGFFATLSLPPELGLVAAIPLLEQRPRIKAGSLALVNTATYEGALRERRADGAKTMERVLAAGQDKSGQAMASMTTLLGHIAALPQDYTIEQLRAIANSPQLAPALVNLRSPEDYACLFARFSEAVGADTMKTRIALARHG